MNRNGAIETNNTELFQDFTESWTLSDVLILPRNVLTCAQIFQERMRATAYEPLTVGNSTLKSVKYMT